MIDPRLLADIKHAEDDKHVEGTNFVAFRDSLGFWTIGYGHLLDQSIDWSGHTITQQTSDNILAADIMERTAQVTRLGEWGSCDTSCRSNALLECVFNLGIGHWQSEFPLTRRAIEAKQWATASANLLASPKWIKQVGLKRVARLADYFASGSYSR